MNNSPVHHQAHPCCTAALETPRSLFLRVRSQGESLNCSLPRPLREGGRDPDLTPLKRERQRERKRERERQRQTQRERKRERERELNEVSCKVKPAN